MKAIIPVAGEGSKLRPHTHTQPKSLVPVAGKPIIAHIVDFLSAEGIRHFTFITGYMSEQVENFLRRYYQDKGLQMEFVLQETREGSAHALWIARAALQTEEPVLIALGDTILDMDLAKLFNSPHNALGVSKVNQPSLFGIAERDREGFVKKLIEKPRIPKSNLALVGIYKIMEPQRLLKALGEVINGPVLTQDEYHLTDALHLMATQGARFITQEVSGWYDCGKKDSLLKSNAMLLHRYQPALPEADRYPSAIFIPPVMVADSCQISNAIVGPNVVLAEHSQLENCIVRNSVIGAYSKLRSLVLEDSLIGSNSAFEGRAQNLNAGDNTELNVGPN